MLKNTIIENLSKVFIFLIIVTVIFSISQELNEGAASFTDRQLSGDEYRKCSLSADQISEKISVSNSEFEIFYSTKSLSMFPEVSNLQCLGKVIEVNYLNNNQLILVTGASPKFSRVVGNLTYVIFLLSSILFLSKNSFYKNVILVSSFIVVLDNLLYLSKNKLTLITEVLFVLIGIYLYQNNSKFDIEDSLTVNRIEYRSDINILRAISVISVLFYHADLIIFQGGWLGVDIFFVISGYLITNIILSEVQDGSFSLKSFYLRRIKRIFPALYFMLLFTIPLSYILLNPKSLIEYMNNLRFSLPFLSNIYLSQLDFYIAEPNKFSPLLHTWSLSIEEQFYLVFPILIIIFHKFSLLTHKTLILCFWFLLGLNLIDISSISKFYLFQFRSWEFFLGFLIMLYSQKNKINFSKNTEKFALLTIVFSLLFFNDGYIDNLFPKVICLLGVSVLLLNHKENLILVKISGVKIFSVIGLMSYSIYLYHQPLYAFVRIYLRRSFEEVGIFQHFFVILLILIISFISYKFIEQPFNNNFHISKFLILIFVAFIGVTYSVIGLQDSGFSSRYDDIPEDVIYYSINTNKYPGDESLDDWDDYSCNSFPLSGYELVKDNPQLFLGPCEYIKKNATSNYILIGDSHANTLAVSTIYWGEKISDKYNFIPLNGTIGRCLLSSQHDTPDFRFDCTDIFFNNFIEKLDSTDIVAVIGRFPNWISEYGSSQLQCEKDCNSEAIIKERFLKIASRVDELIIIYPVPTHPYSITSSYIYRQNIWGEVVATDYSVWSKISEDSHLFLNSIKSDNIVRIKTDDLFCNTLVAEKCLGATEDTLYYADDNHLTIEGNLLILSEIMKIINK